LDIVHRRQTLPGLKERLLARVRKTESVSETEKQQGFLFVRSNEGKWEEISRGVSPKGFSIAYFTKPLLILVRSVILILTEYTLTILELIS